MVCYFFYYKTTQVVLSLSKKADYLHTIHSIIGVYIFSTGRGRLMNKKLSLTGLIKQTFNGQHNF